MRVGLHVMSFDWPDAPASIGPTLASVARAAEEAGIADLSVMDHWFQMDAVAPATDPMLEGYTTLGFVAAHTRTVRLGVLVTGVTYRYPGLLAKMVTTLDVVSGGRGQLGIGAAWYEREHRGLGVPFPPVAERFERLDEALQICLQMWSADDGPFKGRYYTLEETICSPPPITQPRPPILIGGSGEKKTLRLVARYADACNLFAGGRDEIAHKLDVLRGHCDREERDYDSIRKTILVGDPFGDLDHFMAEADAYADLGVDELMFMPSGDPVAYTRRIGELVVPRVTSR
jgi:F420-dependent oxidoreductase-like protein